MPVFNFCQIFPFERWLAPIEQCYRSCADRGRLRCSSHLQTEKPSIWSSFKSRVGLQQWRLLEKPLPQVDSEMLTYIHVHSAANDFSDSHTATQMERRQRGERVAVCCFSMEHAGSSLGESCCFSLHFLSKATYLTPPLKHSRRQVTLCAHPLHFSQPLT